MGMDFQSNLGVARLAPRLKINSQVSDLANLGVPVSFKYFNGAFRAVAGTRVFTGGATPNVAFTQDATASSPTTCSSDTSDSEVFNGSYYVTTQTALVANGTAGSFGAWRSVDAGLTTGFPHIIRFFPQFNRLYYTNGTSVRSIDTSDAPATSGDYFLSLPFGNLVTSMVTTSDSIWIGTESKDVADMNGNIFQWDGISAQATNVFPVQGTAVLALSINEDTGLPCAMDNMGIFSSFNGSGFSEQGRLPYTNILPYDDNGLVSNKFIHPNGLIYTENSTFLALINNLDNDSAGTINENLPSGIWEWSKDTNFVHKYPITYNVVGSGSVRDWGQNRISRAGALMNANIPSNASGRNGTILAGAAFYTDATTTTNAIFIDDSNNTIQKKGYMVTDWWESSEIADKWERFWMSYRKFLDAEDNITLKYRLTEEVPVEGTITWVSTTSFTVLNSAVNVANYWTANTGGEVEITRGDGGAGCAHITNAVLAGGTWTVTLDEVLNPGAAMNTATARFQKWIKLFSAAPVSSPASYAQFGIGSISAPRVQLKMCYTFTGNGEYYKGLIISNEDIKATA